MPNATLVRIQVFPPSTLLATPFCRLGQDILAYKVLEFCGSIAKEAMRVPTNVAEVTSRQFSAPSVLWNTRLSQAGGGVFPLTSHREATTYSVLGLCKSIVSALRKLP